jgi:hypothetical protein
MDTNKHKFEGHEALGVRPACRRFVVDGKAGANSAHSIRFAPFGCW